MDDGFISIEAQEGETGACNSSSSKLDKVHHGGAGTTTTGLRAGNLMLNIFYGKGCFCAAVVVKYYFHAVVPKFVPDELYWLEEELRIY